MGKGKKWTIDEENYLMEYWGIRSIDQIAKKLKKTENAIINKAKRLQLGPFEEAGDLITIWELATALGFETTAWWHKDQLLKKGLPALELRVNKKTIYKIKVDDFFKWVKNNRHSISFAKFERGALGKEPDWVDEKRRIDRMTPEKTKTRRKWTKAEDNALIGMVKTYKYTYKDLSKELNRTENAIRRRLYQLNTYYRPIPAAKVKWTDKDREELKELYNKGYDSHSIAKVMNRHQTSMYNRIKECGL